MEPGKIYHVYNHRNADDNLFGVHDSYMYFLSKYRQHLHPPVNTYCYCLMPNHFHFMLKVKEPNELTQLTDFKNLSSEKFIDIPY